MRVRKRQGVVAIVTSTTRLEAVFDAPANRALKRFPQHCLELLRQMRAAVFQDHPALLKDRQDGRHGEGDDQQEDGADGRARVQRLVVVDEGAAAVGRHGVHHRLGPGHAPIVFAACALACAMASSPLMRLTA